MARRIADPRQPGLTEPIHSHDLQTVTTTASSNYTQPSPILKGRFDRPSMIEGPLPSTSNMEYSELHLAPATRTSVVTTTTTTTVHFAPILIPRTKPPRPTHSSFSHPRRGSRANLNLTPKSSFAQLIEAEEHAARNSPGGLRLDPKIYPLSQAPWPAGFKKFKVALGDLQGTFYEAGRNSGLDWSTSTETDETPSHGQSKGKAPANDNVDMSDCDQLPSPTTVNPRADRNTNLQRRKSRHSISQESRAFRTEIPEDAREESHHLPFAAYDMGSSAAFNNRLPSPGPPRKRPRADSRKASRDEAPVSEHCAQRRPSQSVGYTIVEYPQSVAALPSPNMSPPSPVPTFAGEDSLDCKDDSDGSRPGNDIENQAFDMGSGQPLSGLLSLPDFIDTFDQLTPEFQSYFIFSFLKRSSIPVLQTINNIIEPALRRDILTDLPPELGLHVLSFLETKTLGRAIATCKKWRNLIDAEGRVWKQRLIADNLWVGGGSEEAEYKEMITGPKEAIFLRRWRAGVWSEQNAQNGTWSGKIRSESMVVDDFEGPPSPPRRPSHSTTLASPSSSRESTPTIGSHYVHPFKQVYRKRYVVNSNWAQSSPKRVSFACHANYVVTCLQFDKNKIVSASDSHHCSIIISDTRTGELKGQLDGHEGGVWALQYIGNTLVSGSIDRTVRVWNLATQKCTHIFVGHTSTVRCLQIVEPVNVNPDPTGKPVWEPPYPMIVSGSRDWTLRVWKLPSPGEDREYHPAVPMSPTEENTDPIDNPFHIRHLAGHRHAVRALAAHGRTVVSGSYDTQVRVWDLLTGECRHRLVGHTLKVYSVVYDHTRQQCASGSMDGTVRLWSTETGECKAVLEGHSSLVGLLGLSYRHLVSAAADSTLRIWNPLTGECKATLAAHAGAITCFQHDEYKVISGSDGTLKMWDVRDGSFSKDLLKDLTGVWQVSFDQRFCVAAVQRNGQSEIEILDFGPVDEAEEREDDEEKARNKVKAEQQFSQVSLGDGTDHLVPLAIDDADEETEAHIDGFEANRDRGGHSEPRNGRGPLDPATSVLVTPTRPRPPPVMLRPSEFPRDTLVSGRHHVIDTSGGNSAAGEDVNTNELNVSGTVAGGSSARVIRRTGSSRQLGAFTPSAMTTPPRFVTAPGQSSGASGSLASGRTLTSSRARSLSSLRSGSGVRTLSLNPSFPDHHLGDDGESIENDGGEDDVEESENEDGFDSSRGKPARGGSDRIARRSSHDSTHDSTSSVRRIRKDGSSNSSSAVSILRRGDSSVDKTLISNGDLAPSSDSGVPESSRTVDQVEVEQEVAESDEDDERYLDVMQPELDLMSDEDVRGGNPTSSSRSTGGENMEI